MRKLPIIFILTLLPVIPAMAASPNCNNLVEGKCPPGCGGNSLLGCKRCTPGYYKTDADNRACEPCTPSISNNYIYPDIEDNYGLTKNECKKEGKTYIIKLNNKKTNEVYKTIFVKYGEGFCLQDDSHTCANGPWGAWNTTWTNSPIPDNEMPWYSTFNGYATYDGTPYFLPNGYLNAHGRTPINTDFSTTATDRTINLYLSMKCSGEKQTITFRDTTNQTLADTKECSVINCNTTPSLLNCKTPETLSTEYKKPGKKFATWTGIVNGSTKTYAKGAQIDFDPTNQTIGLTTTLTNCDADHFCTGDGSEEDCPTGTKSAASSQSKTNCYLNPNIQFTDDNGTFTREKPVLHFPTSPTGAQLFYQIP